MNIKKENSKEKSKEESTGEKIKRTKNRQKYGRKSTTNALQYM